ncbi:MAG TPA: c-type cytochrome domain-containing protein [Fimbriiglobus sp.]|jgi:WD40 repeat protein
MKLLRSCYCVLCALAAALLAALLFGPAANAADQPVSFIKDVAPVLKESCFACHDAKKKSGKLDMTTFAKLAAGGSDGEVFVPGKPAESDLHELMVTKEDRRMPPRDKGEAVAKEKAALVARWIAEGAKLDAGIDPKADLVKELRVRWVPPISPRAYAFPAVVNALCFSPDGRQLVVGGYHELTVWDPAEKKLLKRIATRAERAYALVFLPDGKLACAGGRPGQEGDVRIYNLAAAAKETIDSVAYLDGVNDTHVLTNSLLDTDDSVLCLALSPDGAKLAAGGTDRTVRIWDVAKFQLEQMVENHADWVLGLTFTKGGKYLLTAGRDKTAKVWDLKAKESVMTFPDHQDIVYGVAAKLDGAVGYSVGADRQIRSWKPGGEGKQLKASGGHGNAIFKVAFSPKDNLLATTGADGTVRLWTADKLSNSKTLTGFTDYVYALAFRPDGRQIAAAGYEGLVHIWSVPDGKSITVFSASPGYVPKGKPGNQETGR